MAPMAITETTVRGYRIAWNDGGPSDDKQSVGFDIYRQDGEWWASAEVSSGGKLILGDICEGSVPSNKLLDDFEIALGLPGVGLVRSPTSPGGVLGPQ